MGLVVEGSRRALTRRAAAYTDQHQQPPDTVQQTLERNWDEVGKPIASVEGVAAQSSFEVSEDAAVCRASYPLSKSSFLSALLKISTVPSSKDVGPSC